MAAVLSTNMGFTQFESVNGLSRHCVERNVYCIHSLCIGRAAHWYVFGNACQDRTCGGKTISVVVCQQLCSISSQYMGIDFN